LILKKKNRERDPKVLLRKMSLLNKLKKYHLTLIENLQFKIDRARKLTAP